MRPRGGCEIVREVTRRPQRAARLTAEPDNTIDAVEAGYVFGFVGRARQRHAALARRIFMICLALGLLVAALLSPIYRVEARLLLNLNDRMAARVSPDRKMPKEEPDPEHKDFLEQFYSNDNLANIVDDFELPTRFAHSRSAGQRLKDAAFQRLFGKLSESAQQQIFITLLQKNIAMKVQDEVIEFAVDWPDPDIALGLSETAVARFVKMRRDVELQQILDTKRLLERQAAAERAEIDAVVARMASIFAAKAQFIRQAVAEDMGMPVPEEVAQVTTVYRPTPAQQRANSAAQLLRKQLHGKKSSHQSVLKGYEANLRAAAEKVELLKQSLGPKHPDYIEAQRALVRASQVPNEVRQVQEEVQSLSTALQGVVRRGGRGAPRVSVTLKPSSGARQKNDDLRRRSAAIFEKRLEDDPEVRTILGEIRRRESAYERLNVLLDSARLEGDAANAAFEARYILTVPPIFPRSTSRPMAAMVSGGAAVLGLLLALVGVLIADVGSRRVQESWQLKRFLRLRVLGEVDE